MTDTADATEGEIYGHVALYLDQIKSLYLVLQTVLEEETQKPLQGDQAGAVAIALERAAEDALSVFEAHYHPRRDAGLSGLEFVEENASV